MLSAFLGIILVGIIGNLITGNFNLGFANQPIAHTEWIWNFLGMLLVGFCSVLLGGCPFRQVVLAGSGNSDSVLTVLGMTAGAAFAHNFDMASSSTHGVTSNGKIGFLIAIVIVSSIAILNTFQNKQESLA
jgi:YedE family putative selenium metabolism protein